MTINASGRAYEERRVDRQQSKPGLHLSLASAVSTSESKSGRKVVHRARGREAGRRDTSARSH
jgi:hypothetical protein